MIMIGELLRIERVTSIVNSRIKFNNNWSSTNRFQEIRRCFSGCGRFLSPRAHSLFLTPELSLPQPDGRMRVGKNNFTKKQDHITGSGRKHKDKGNN